jgi:hypothetical protein
MKRLLFLCTALFAGLLSTAQPNHPNSPHDTVSTKDVKITYGRPSMKGREIFGKLVPYGKVYRLGADEATTITFAKDGTFGGKSVKAGTYALFAIPGEKSWTIILNGNPKQWGAFDYDKNKSKDVLHADVPAKMLSAPVEQFTIDLSNEDLSISWEKTRVDVPLKF